MKKLILDEQALRMQKLAGINESDDIFNNQYEVDEETYTRMDDLIQRNKKDSFNKFLDSAEAIMSELRGSDFEAKQAFYYLYTRLTSNI
jgi:hypothetical protein